MLLQNQFISAEIANHGAELTSLQKDGVEYLWNADPKYWKRHAPILFPIVGKVFDNHYFVNGVQYSLPQHGFARDLDFQVVELTENQAVLELRSTEETLKSYPYPFLLRVCYHLEDNKINCCWTVENPSDSDIYFQIGAHPAFLIRETESGRGMAQLLGKNIRGYQPLQEAMLSTLDGNGYLNDGRLPMALQSGEISLAGETFDGGALIFEHSQAQSAILADGEGHPYLRMTFDDAPVLGLWSPEGKNAPFVCIEPWHGRCDYDFAPNDISERDWINHLPAAGQFKFNYTIELL